MATLNNETKFTHLSNAGTTKTITIPATTAGSKLIVFVNGGAIATFRISNGAGTEFTRRNPYGGGDQDASWHDFIATGGETIVHMTLNGSENVAGVIYEVSDIGSFIAASNNGTGNTVISSNNFHLSPSSSITVSEKAVLFGGFSIPETIASSSTRRWRQFGPVGNLKTFDAWQPGSNTQFIWATGMADIDQNHSYPENLPSGQYRATSQFIASSGSASFAAQVAYSNSGSNINASPNNDIIKENSLPGNHEQNWFLGVGGTNGTIAGYTDKTSYELGDTVNFKVDSTNNPFRVEIYRLGFYGSEQIGARNILGINTYISGTPTIQPAPEVDSTLGHTYCSWSTNASWSIPLDATPGVYYVLFRRTDETTNISSCHFVVKSSPENKAVIVVPDHTYQAYNIWGATTNNGTKALGTWTGRSLYQRGQDGGSPNFANRAYAVSFNRPYSIQSTQSNTYMFDSEYGILVFAEAQGYDLTYASDLDLENDDSYLNFAKLVMINGHSEYWSTNVWNCYKNARDAGVNLMFNSSNIALWKVRYESEDSNKRTMICYKDSGTIDETAGFAGTGIDPVEYTGTWRDSRTLNPNNSDRRKEDSLTGMMFKINAPVEESFEVDFESKEYPIWRNSTDIQALSSGQIYTTPVGVIGDEVDYVDPSSTTKPTNMVILNPTMKNFPGKGSNENGTIYSGNTGNIYLGFSLYRASSGALVFCTGSWRAWLTIARWRRSDYLTEVSPDINWQNAFLSIMYDLGIEPQTLKTMLPTDAALTDPAVGSPGEDRDEIALAYTLDVPVESNGTGNFLGFFM